MFANGITTRDKQELRSVGGTAGLSALLQLPCVTGCSWRVGANATHQACFRRTQLKRVLNRTIAPEIALLVSEPLLPHLGSPSPRYIEQEEEQPVNSPQTPWGHNPGQGLEGTSGDRRECST